MENDYQTTEEHSVAYDRRSFMLVPFNVGTTERPEMRIYTPEDDTAMYDFTAWLKDWEIPWINQMRYNYNPKTKPVYRLARTKNGYTRATSINNRIEIERREFPATADGIQIIGITKQFEKNHIRF